MDESDHAAWIAAALAAWTGLFSFYEALILQTSLDAAFTSAALYLLTRALRASDARKGARWMLATGVVFGLITAAWYAAYLLTLRRGGRDLRAQRMEQQGRCG